MRYSMVHVIVSLLFFLSSTVFAQDAFNAIRRSNRRLNAKIARDVATNQRAQQTLQPQPTNGDQQRYADLRGSYGKGLKQLDSGFIDPAAYNQLVRATQLGTS